MEKLGGNRFSGTIGTLLKGEPIMGDGLPQFFRNKIVLLQTIYSIAIRGTIFTSGALCAMWPASET
jgi:hypothetical protein